MPRRAQGRCCPPHLNEDLDWDGSREIEIQHCQQSSRSEAVQGFLRTISLGTLFAIQLELSALDPWN